MSFDPYQSPQTQNYIPQPPNNNLAVFSLILGISSLLAIVPAFCCCLPIFVVIPASLTAIGLGVAAIVRINQGRATGQALAIIGITCGSLSLFLTVAFFVAIQLGTFNNQFQNPFLPRDDIEIEDFDFEGDDFDSIDFESNDFESNEIESE